MVKIPALQELLEKEVTRKEFLQMVGLMILSVIGVGSVLANLDKSLTTKTANNDDDYGISSYGG